MSWKAAVHSKMLNRTFWRYKSDIEKRKSSVAVTLTLSSRVASLDTPSFGRPQVD